MFFEGPTHIKIPSAVVNNCDSINFQSAFVRFWASGFPIVVLIWIQKQNHLKTRKLQTNNNNDDDNDIATLFVMVKYFYFLHKLCRRQCHCPELTILFFGLPSPSLSLLCFVCTSLPTTKNSQLRICVITVVCSGFNIWFIYYKHIFFFIKTLKNAAWKLLAQT